MNGVDWWPRSVAIIGAGTMGIGVAEAFAVAGVSVCIVDATPELTQKTKERLVERAREHEEADLLAKEAVDRVEVVKRGKDISEAVQGANLIFEAVPEHLELKCELFATISEVVTSEAIIASNTSSLPIDDLARSVERPERFLGLHWFNPPEWTPGVEVIPSSKTDREVAERMVEFLLSIGKQPVILKSSPGFVANRVQMALFREALSCVEDGLATPQEVDEVVRSCFGFRLPFFGPFQIADMAGLDVYVNVFETLESGIGERFHPPKVLRDMVEQGHTGTKSGEGFFKYPDERSSQLLMERDRRYVALSELIERLPPFKSTPKEGDDQW